MSDIHRNITLDFRDAPMKGLVALMIHNQVANLGKLYRKGLWIDSPDELLDSARALNDGVSRPELAYSCLDEHSLWQAPTDGLLTYALETLNMDLSREDLIKGAKRWAAETKKGFSAV